MRLFKMCLLRASSVATPQQVVEWVSEDVLEKLFDPLRCVYHPRNMVLRRWIAGCSLPLSLRGKFCVVGTAPAGSVRTLRHCDRLTLERFDVTALCNVTFKNLTNLYIRFPMPCSRTAINIDGLLKNSSHCKTNKSVHRSHYFADTQYSKRRRSWKIKVDLSRVQIETGALHVSHKSKVNISAGTKETTQETHEVLERRV